MQSLHKKKYLKKNIVAVMLVATIMVWNIGSVRAILTEKLHKVLLPLIRAGSVVGYSVRARMHFFYEIPVLHEKNQILQDRVLDLESENVQYKDVIRENEALREQLKLPTRESFDLLGADVVGRDVLGGGQWILINRGTDDGVAVGMTVVYGKNQFVGRIVSVYEGSAKVMLLTNPRMRLAVTEVVSGANAVAHGEHGLALLVSDIAQDAIVQEDTSFVTARIGVQDTPFGLIVGSVQEIVVAEDQVSQQARIVPLYDVQELRHVFIINAYKSL